jgi:acyl-coenzyme A synthetase/AMP-(fatty) acid ligase
MKLATPFAGSRPDSIVAFDGARAVQAAELRGGAREVAGALPPPRRGEEVVVLCRDRVAFAAALLGAWEAGYGVALPPNARPETVRQIRERPGVRTVLHDGEGPKGIDVSPLVGDARALDAPYPTFAASRPLVTVYTSGSTGEHRPCPKNARQLLGEVAILIAAFPDAAGARTLAIVPPHHIYGLLFGVLVPLSSGGAFAIQPGHTPQAVADAIVRDRVDVVVSVPAHLAGMRVLPALPRVRRVFSSGAPLPADTARAMAEGGWPVSEVLGSSETGGIAWRTKPEAPWTPLPSVSIAVDDDEHLLIDSPLLSDDTPRPYVSADRARLFPDGRFEHLGRADGVLKIGSMRISVAHLEQHLRDVDGVRDVAVLPVEVGGARGWETWAVLVAPGHDAASIRAGLRCWLDPVLMPRRFRFVEELPREPTGKLRRADLEALFARTGREGDGGDR